MRAAILGAVALAGCASMVQRPLPRLSEIRAPARTSVDVLLGNTVDLELSTEQVSALVKLQAELNGQVKAIKEEMAAIRAAGPELQAPPPPPPAAPSAPITPYPPVVGPGRWVGNARESGDLGPPRGPRERPEAPPPDYAERRAKLEALLKKYDEVDAAAYAKAEALLSEPQKAAARKLMAERAAERAPAAGR